MSARFHLDPINWYTRADASDVLKPPAAAVWNERRIRVRYESWKGLVERKLDPLGLVLKGGIWYLVAAVKDTPRTYRVSNIQEMQTLDAGLHASSPLQPFALLSEWSKDFGSAAAWRARDNRSLPNGAPHSARYQRRRA